MSSTPIDPDAQRYIDEFQQGLAQSGRFYREALKAIAVDSLQREFEAMQQRQQAPPPVAPTAPKPIGRRATDAGKSAGRWVVSRFRRAHTPTSAVEKPDVIEGEFVVQHDAPARTQQERDAGRTGSTGSTGDTHDANNVDHANQVRNADSSTHNSTSSYSTHQTGSNFNNFSGFDSFSDFSVSEEGER